MVHQSLRSVGFVFVAFMIIACSESAEPGEGVARDEAQSESRPEGRPEALGAGEKTLQTCYYCPNYVNGECGGEIFFYSAVRKPICEACCSVACVSSVQPGNCDDMR